MTEEAKKLKSALSYRAPELVSLGSVEKLTAGNQSRDLDGGVQNPTYIYMNEEEKPKK